MSSENPVYSKPKSEEIAPAPARQQQPDAVYHRSPTLLASESGGNSEGVQVWAPNTFMLLAEAGYAGIHLIFFPALVFLNFIVLSFVVAHPTFIRLSAILFLALNDINFIRMIRNMPSLRNKVYITTDASGIAIRTHKRETRAIYWKDIQSVALSEKKITLLQQFNIPIHPGRKRRVAFGKTKITFLQPERTEIRLQGYPAETRKQLLALIVERAGLVPKGKQRLLLVKAPPALAQAS